MHESPQFQLKIHSLFLGLKTENFDDKHPFLICIHDLNLLPHTEIPKYQELSMLKETTESTWYWDSHRTSEALDGHKESSKGTLYFVPFNLF